MAGQVFAVALSLRWLFEKGAPKRWMSGKGAPKSKRLPLRSTQTSWDQRAHIRQLSFEYVSLCWTNHGRHSMGEPTINAPGALSHVSLQSLSSYRSWIHPTGIMQILQVLHNCRYALFDTCMCCWKSYRICLIWVRPGLVFRLSFLVTLLGLMT